jgi:hypothetical protein
MAAWPTPVANDDNKTPEAHLAMKQRMGERDGTGANRTAITSLQVMAQMASWPTPMACDQRGSAGVGKPELPNVAALASWQTPTVNDASGSDYTYASGNHDRPFLKLPGQAKLTAWATPTCGSPNSLLGRGQDPMKRKAGNHAVNLQDQVTLASGPTPSGSPAATAKPGQLNPAFARWLMGYGVAWCQAAIRASRTPTRVRKPA